MTAVAPQSCSYGSRKFNWYMDYIDCGRLALEEAIGRWGEMDMAKDFSYGSFIKVQAPRADKIILKYPLQAQTAIT